MPIEIKITAADVTELEFHLRQLGGWFEPRPTGPFSGAPEGYAEAEIASREAAMAEEQAERKAKRGRPKKEADPAPANDEKPTMTAAQAEQWAQGAKDVAAEQIAMAEQPLVVKPTRDDCMNAMRHVSEKFGYDHTRALLQKFDTPKLSLLPEEKYADFIKAAYDWKAEVA